MKLIDSILNYFKAKEKNKNIVAPEGICGPCWGHQEYDNQFRDIIKDKQIDVNGGREKLNFIENVVVNKVEGIRLKNTLNGMECPTCKKIS